MSALDPRWRRAEAIRARVLELLAAPAFGAGTCSQIRKCMFDLFPHKAPAGAEVQRALQVLRRQGKVKYRGRLWRLA